MFNESLQNAIATIQTKISTITGIMAAPANPPDAPSGQWPLSIAFPRSGQFSGGGQTPVFGHHIIFVQLHYARKDMQRAYAAIVPYLEAISGMLLADPTISGTVTTISGNISYMFGGMEFANIQTIGWEFQIPVKIRYTEKEEIEE